QRQRQRRHRRDDPAARTTSLASGVLPFLSHAVGIQRRRGWCKIRASSAVTTAFSSVPLHRRQYYRQNWNSAKKSRSRRICMQGTWRRGNGALVLKLWEPAAGSTGGISKHRPASAQLRVVIWWAEYTSGLRCQAHSWLRWVAWHVHSQLKLL
uniref:Uncharacterized protein n=1 Tax=Triticum urartu TaxID=4572 RepID=A0A8R7UT03_TRIUA